MMRKENLDKPTAATTTVWMKKSAPMRSRMEVSCFCAVTARCTSFSQHS
ncbi:unnamed protein product [Nippostrongylus brasiliensis]|uniref:Uncharacterized protein n=1 Tax=Nippostrongylus brasiliensis TaxID=27835 RepID=A0A0N4XSB1_NIPBR|nr:unnamed protein product [Nippostrongylus brasiliensis]